MQFKDLRVLVNHLQVPFLSLGSVIFDGEANRKGIIWIANDDILLSTAIVPFLHSLLKVSYLFLFAAQTIKRNLKFRIALDKILVESDGVV